MEGAEAGLGTKMAARVSGAVNDHRRSGERNIVGLGKVRETKRRTEYASSARAGATRFIPVVEQAFLFTAEDAEGAEEQHHHFVFW